MSAAVLAESMLALLVRLRPSSPWRIGPDSGDRDRVGRIYHSDALYAAVTSAMAQLGQLEDWLQATARAENPAVRFSSCFPSHGETLYVTPPRHLWPPPPSSKIRWKNATFVPVNVVMSLLAGEALREDSWVIDSASECLLPASAPAGSGLFRASVRSNAAVDRAGVGVASHSTACLEFAPNSGLWFAVAFADGQARSRWQGPLRGAIRLLADSGFGGERSRGWGRAETPHFVEGRWPDLLTKRAEPSGQTASWLLSLYHPADRDQIDWERGSYLVSTRSGRVESDAGWGQAKNTTRMITEGSVLVAPGELRGSAPDVAPQGFAHPVYRAGFALAVRVPMIPLWTPALASAPVSVLTVNEKTEEANGDQKIVESGEVAEQDNLAEKAEAVQTKDTVASEEMIEPTDSEDAPVIARVDEPASSPEENGA